MLDREEIHDMIKDCLNRESKLTEWEKDFMFNIYEQDRDLTEKQIEKLEMIWDRVT